MNILMTFSNIKDKSSKIYTFALANEFCNRNNNVFIASDYNIAEFISKAEYFRINFASSSIFGKIFQIKKLINIINKNNIQIVHVTSYDALLPSAIACFITSTPLVITFTKIPDYNFLTMKFLNKTKYNVIATSEALATYAQDFIKISYDKIKLNRFPIKVELYKENSVLYKKNQIKVVTIIGDVLNKNNFMYNLIGNLYHRTDFRLQVIYKNKIPKKFQKFARKVEFFSESQNLVDEIRKSNLVISYGRAIVESVLQGVPSIAVNETNLIGVITTKNISKALETNFCEISFNNDDNRIKFSSIIPEIEKAFNLSSDETFKISSILKVVFSTKLITNQIEKTYQSLISKSFRYEMPILYYNKIIKNKTDTIDEISSITLANLEKQLKFLNKNKYTSKIFSELLNENYRERFSDRNKWIVLAFNNILNDGIYKEIYQLLKKYKIKAVFYIDETITFSDDATLSSLESYSKLFPKSHFKEMEKFGIELGRKLSNLDKYKEYSYKKLYEKLYNDKLNLELLLSTKIYSFFISDPNEKIDFDLKKALKENSLYNFAISDISESKCISDDIYDIRPIEILNTDSFSKFQLKASGSYFFD